MFSALQRLLPAGLLALFVLFLVPFGRSLQNIGRELALLYPGACITVAALLTISCLILLVRFILMTARTTRQLAVLQSVSLIGVLYWVFGHIDGIWIELTHILYYGGFYAFLRRGIKEARFPALKTGLAGFFLCLLDEGLQHLHPERVGDLRDIQLNLASLLIAAILIEPFYLLGVKRTNSDT